MTRPLSMIGLLLMPAALSTAQTPQVRHVLTADSTWISGIAEPASGRFMIYAEEDSTIRIVNRATGKTRVVPMKIVSNDNNSIGLSRSGNLLAFVRADDTNKGPFVWTQALDSMTGEPHGAPRRVTVVKSRVAQPSSDGKWIAFVADDGNHNLVMGGTRLLVVPSEGGTARMLDSSASGMGSPRWSPDDKWIYYERRPALMRIRVAGGKPDSIGTTGRLVDISPDGSMLAHYSGPLNWNNGAHTLDIVRTDGSVVVRLNSDVWENRAFAWSADGKSLLAMNSVEPVRLRAMRIEDGAMTPFPLLADREAKTEEPTYIGYSPDGSHFAMVSGHHATRTLSIYTVATRSRRDFPLSGEVESWKWSPNGRYLSYLDGRATPEGFDNHLGVIELATGKHRELGNIGAQTRYHWRSDNSGIDFIRRPSPGASAAMATIPASFNHFALDGKESIDRTLKPTARGVFIRILDDSLIVLAQQPEGDVVLMDVRRGVERRIYTGRLARGSYNRGMVLTPDRKAVIFSVDVGNNQSQMTRVSLDGSSQRLLGTPGCGNFAQEFRAGGEEILTNGWDCERDVETYGLTAMDGSPTRFFKIKHTSNDGQLGHVFLTPDGKTALVPLFIRPLVSITAIEVNVPRSR